MPHSTSPATRRAYVALLVHPQLQAGAALAAARRRRSSTAAGRRSATGSPASNMKPLTRLVEVALGLRRAHGRERQRAVVAEPRRHACARARCAPSPACPTAARAGPGSAPGTCARRGSTDARHAAQLVVALHAAGARDRAPRRRAPRAPSRPRSAGRSAPSVALPGDGPRLERRAATDTLHAGRA